MAVNSYICKSLLIKVGWVADATMAVTCIDSYSPDYDQPRGIAHLHTHVSISQMIALSTEQMTSRVSRRSRSTEQRLFSSQDDLTRATSTTTLSHQHHSIFFTRLVRRTDLGPCTRSTPNPDRL
jgi:hypothetical protein